MTKRLDDKVAIVTGAASGIGKAMAVLFAREGAEVVASDILSEALHDVVSEINASGGKAVGVTANVAEESDIAAMVETAINSFGRIDILCNNAGVLDGMTPITEVTDELWERIIGINLNGPFRTCRKVIPIMLEQGGGVILNTASAAGLFGCRGGVTYTTSKHAVVGLTKNIAFTYAQKGIRCNAICPGGVETNIVGGAFNEFGFSRMGLGVPLMPRMGKPEEVATVALMLVSDDGSFVNGVAMPVDAGWMAY
jgi:NAD(P)-dependent dehydrogenase (short-subunit alcohol dehydrogenase family)